MGTKITCAALYKPLEKILSNDKMEADDKIKMALEIIADILKQAETKD